MSVFRLIEGVIAIARPPKPRPYFYAESDYVPATDVLFDFGGIIKDVAVITTHNTIIKFNSASSLPINLNPGPTLFTDQFASKVYVTFHGLPTTHFLVFSNS